MRHIFIINPKAGKHADPQGLVANIESVMGDREFDIHITGAAGEATELSRRLVSEAGDCRVYACGGDGTLSEVLNGIAGHENAALSVIPFGTANDFVKLFGAANFRDIAALVDGEERTLDLIKANDKYSIDICSVGFDARTARDVGKFKKLPLVTSFGAFTMSALYNLFKGLCYDYKIEADGENLDGRYALICIANARHYGGGYMPMGDAHPYDGVLDLLLIKNVSRLRVPSLLGRYKKGQYAKLGDIAERRTVKEMKVEFVGREGVVNTDGEMLHTGRATISMAPIKQRFVAPKGAWDALDRELKAKQEQMQA